jgi:very-short-patch-repair endonuclease
MAAVLACGPGAVLSHAAAAALWSIRPTAPPGAIDVTLRTRAGRRRRPGAARFERAIDEGDRLSLVTADDLIELLRRHRGHPGARRLRGVIARHQIGSTPTRSELEERLLALCRRYRLPQPEVNVPLLEYVVDFLWRDARLIVEADGRATHGTRRAFQADRDRDGRLAVAGYLVLRFTWWDVTRRSVVVADRVRRVLAGRICAE